MPLTFLRVTKLKYSKIATNKGNTALDTCNPFYNYQLTISGTPLEVQVYVANKKSSLDWVMEH